MTQPPSPLIVALDVPTFKQAQKLVEVLKDTVDIFKVGSELFTACGVKITDYIQSRGKKVFLDLKYHDIPNTVANAVSSAVRLNKIKLGIFMLTVHTSGGKEMLRAAVEAAKKEAFILAVDPPLILGVTVLTSEMKADTIAALVLERAQLAQEAGLNGVVASAHEAALIRSHLGRNFVIVTPGIRPQGFPSDDQKRVVSVAEAVKQGSNFLVVGRPILKASDPRRAAKEILKEIKETAL